METLVLPAEMVAESVVNSIQTNNFEADEEDMNPLIQTILALALGSCFIEMLFPV